MITRDKLFGSSRVRQTDMSRNENPVSSTYVNRMSRQLENSSRFCCETRIHYTNFIMRLFSSSNYRSLESRVSDKIWGRNCERDVVWAFSLSGIPKISSLYYKQLSYSIYMSKLFQLAATCCMNVCLNSKFLQMEKTSQKTGEFFDSFFRQNFACLAQLN